MEGGATPSTSTGDVHKESPQRAPVQSPVGAAAGEKAKTVFNSIISPVLTLFQGKQEGNSREPSVVLEVGTLFWNPISCKSMVPSAKHVSKSFVCLFVWNLLSYFCASHALAVHINVPRSLVAR